MKRPIVDLDTHSALDYAFVATASTMPYWAGFSHVPRAKRAIQGIIAASVSKDLVTRYKYSVANLIPIGPHLIMDLIVGTAVAAAPFVLGFRKQLTTLQTAGFVLFGLSAFGLVAITGLKTERGKREALIEDPEAAKVDSLSM